MALNSPPVGLPYHVLSIQGGVSAGSKYHAKSGKTHQAINGLPGKVFIASSEGGWDGIVQKLYPDTWQERFFIHDFYCSVDLTADELFSDATSKDEKEVAYKLADKQAERVTRETWGPFSATAKEAFADPRVRSCVWDLADDFYAWLRLANFGKLERNPQMGYGRVNTEWADLIRKARQYRKNLVLINSVKQKYRNAVDENGREKSVAVEGVFERKGSDSIEYLVHSFIEAHYIEAQRDAKGNVTRPHQFLLKILRARLNPEANGMVIPACDWPTLMSLLAPDVPGERWLEEAA